MTDNSAAQTLLKVGALFLIGDGLLGLIMPRRRSLLWYCGPQLAKAVAEELADHPSAARAVYLAETALGVALMAAATPEEE